MGKLQERVALVTEGGRGIGRAIALALAWEGARIAVTARTRSELDEVCAACRNIGGQAVAVAADLADRESCRRVVEEVTRQLGAVEVLVNNAGIGSSADLRPLDEFDDDFWDRSLAVNLTGPYLLCKTVLPAMRSKQWGRIINIASINSRLPSPHAAA
jgi:3-oxoacyl-[acyl-carrier protein] reductase